MSAPSLRFVLAAVPITVTFGCQAPDITEELDTYQQLYDDTNWLVCECPQDLGFGTTSECRDVVGYISPDARQCLEDVLDREKASDAEEFLSCTNSALQKYEQCLAANVDCEDGVNDGCASNYAVESAQCTQISSDAKAAFLTCTG